MKLLPFDFGNHTDKGIVREINEDAMAFYGINGGYLFLVADGMGGHAAGDEASKIAIESIKNFFQNISSFDNIHELMIQSVEIANRNIYEYSLQNPNKKGMGTTIVVAFIYGEVITIGHVGDSRAYRYNPETGLQVLTKDHSFVQELVNQGIISDEEAHYHPRKNEITRALGIRETVVPDIQQHTIRDNDIFAFMSDGICSLLTHEQIHQILSNSEMNAQQKAEKLVNLANELGGYDNSTVQIISYNHKIVQNPEKDTLLNTIKIENIQENLNHNSINQNLPKSSTQDSGLRYYLFIGTAIVTIALIFYYFLLNSQIVRVDNNSQILQNTLANQVIPKEDTVIKKPKNPEPLFIQYQVIKNDKLELLSKRFNYPIDSIKVLNGLKNTKIVIGQELTFPIQAIHEISKDEKIVNIAQNYGVSTNDILKINGIKNPDKLNIGKKIYIPLKENNN